MEQIKRESNKANNVRIAKDTMVRRFRQVEDEDRRSLTASLMGDPPPDRRRLIEQRAKEEAEKERIEANRRNKKERLYG